MGLNRELIEILACPACRGRLAATPGEDGLHCPACKVFYPVRDEIPVMLVAEAVPEAHWTGTKQG